MTTRFRGLLPPQAVVVEAEPAMWESGLLPDEVQHVARSVAKRRREFTAGRNCARRALQLLGIEPAAIPVGPGRAPVFPAGISGSITHTAAYCAAALIPTSSALTIGIDAEADTPMGAGVRKLVLGPVEHAMVTDLAAHEDHCWDKLVFSAKESFHKALFQQVPITLDFLDAAVRIDPEQHSFEIQVIAADASVPDTLRRRGFTGFFRFEDGLVLSAIALPAALR